MNTKLNKPIITFDIGGTWFRFGIANEDGILADYSKLKAINYKTHPHSSTDELQQKLVYFILEHTEKLIKKHQNKTINTVSISMGAAVNSHSGIILNSGPLWGPNSKGFNLKQILKNKNNNINWFIVNDISAALLFHANKTKLNKGKIALITISTGIGSRTYNLEKKSIPTDSRFGIQGEIGHIPIHFSIKNRLIQLKCDCGGKNHLNAFCSGRGIPKILPLIAETYTSEYKSSKLYDRLGDNLDLLTFPDLIESINNLEKFGFIVLKYITKPLAEIIIYQLTFDPEIKNIILTGGVAHSLNPHFLEILLQNLNEIGMYQISDIDRNFFKDKIIIGDKNDKEGLIGAAYFTYI